MEILGLENFRNTKFLGQVYFRNTKSTTEEEHKKKQGNEMLHEKKKKQTACTQLKTMS